jgi:hypothetical protein
LLIFMTDWSKTFLRTTNYARREHYSFNSLSAYIHVFIPLNICCEGYGSSNYLALI